MTVCLSFLGLILQVFLFSILTAATSSGQDLKNVKVTMSNYNITFEQALRIIEKQTNFKFFYSSHEIPVDKKVTIDVTDESLYEILKGLASQYGLVFQRINDQIIIKKVHLYKENDAASPPGPGTIRGTITDVSTAEPLYGANIMLEGTSMGAASDIYGKFIIQNIPLGTYTLKVSYLGYKTESVILTVKEGQHIEQNFKLRAVGITGETVVVTAQASGQSQAINQQLSSDQIVNIVSAARIQELPDANAAESVGRLPGASVLRNGGEGFKVVIRGLAPKYNKITIDGVPMSASDPYDRSTDLSMITSNMLEGIQVSKTVTADMDPDVIGGTVNFELREAKASKSDIPQFGLLGQGGYNSLSNAYNKFNNYKYVGSVEDRFMNERLGIFAQIDIERKNLTSNEFGASYDHIQNSTTDYKTLGLSLLNIPRDRKRYNGALVADYKLLQGKIKLTNYLSSQNTDVQNRNEYYSIASNLHSYNLSYSNSTLNMVTNALNFQQELPWFSIDVKLSHTYSETESPSNWSVNFNQSSAGIGQFNEMPNLNPQDIVKAAAKGDTNATLNTFLSSRSFSKQRSFTTSLDLKKHLVLSDNISAEIKVGGKYQYQTRSYLYDQYDGQLVGYVVNQTLIFPHFSLPTDGQRMKYWIDPNYNYGKFLNGDYKMNSALNFGMISELNTLLKSNVQRLADEGYAVYFGQNNFASTTNDYSGNENQSALYLMSTIKIGQDITFIPGIRYQNLKTTYKGIRGIASLQSQMEYAHYDTTVIQDHGYWLPDISLRYKPLSWFDIRLSYTNTIAYPDYYAIIPRIHAALSGMIAWNNYELVPSRSTNYDVYLSFYNNTIGLFTAGAFLKQIKDLIYPWSFYVSANGALRYYPTRLLGSTPLSGTYNIITYKNNSYKINDYGMELDWQTHFWYLPGPLSGLVLNVNYTHIFSKAQYPYTLTKITGRAIKYIDTSYTARLLYQPDDIINLSLGYDYKGFSIRVSMLYQSNIFTGPNFWPQLRTNTATYRRWDIAFKQDLPWFGIQLFGDINNLNGADDLSVIQGYTGVPQSQQSYGMTADLGLRIKF